MGVLVVWSLFGVLVWQLGEVRTRVAENQSQKMTQEENDRAHSVVQSLLRETRDERSALEKFMNTDALAAAAAIEAAGKRAGVAVTIGGAVPSQNSAVNTESIREVTMVANAEGEFPLLMRAAEIFETLPFPSRIESYELSSLDRRPGQKDPWQLVARIRVLIPSEPSL